MILSDVNVQNIQDYIFTLKKKKDAQSGALVAQALGELG